ncbi:unnamed protein product, partial [Adineta steineri]
IDLIDISCEFTDDIHSSNDLWHVLKESHDVDSVIPSDRFDLELFTAYTINMDNDGQLRQKRIRAGYFYVKSIMRYV